MTDLGGSESGTNVVGCPRHGGFTHGCGDCARILSEAIAKIQPEPPRGPITGGFIPPTTCPHCGRTF